jgi:TonB family protein
MKRLRAVCCVVALACGCAGAGLAQEAKAAPAGGTQTTVDGHAVGQGVEILSDTQGVNFQPYLKDAIHQIYAQWLTLMPEQARSHKEKGVTQIRFTISPDGTIAAMHLEDSAHDVALDRAAWGAITGVGKFPVLPSAFHGPNLDLRIHFVVNNGSAVPAAGKAGV